MVNVRRAGEDKTSDLNTTRKACFQSFFTIHSMSSRSSTSIRPLMRKARYMYIIISDRMASKQLTAFNLSAYSLLIPATHSILLRSWMQAASWESKKIPTPPVFFFCVAFRCELGCNNSVKRTTQAYD